MMIPNTRQPIKNLLNLIKEYYKISKSGEIVRRLFALNFFDGILTVLGILFGSYVGNISQPKVIITTGVGAAVAMGVSGFWGAYEAERTERLHSRKELESATLSNLEGTIISKANNFAVWVIAITNSISPFVGGMIVISPFFFSSLLSIDQMYRVSIGISFASLMTLGAYLGKISHRNMIRSALRMTFAGVLCAALIILVLYGVGV